MRRLPPLRVLGLASVGLMVVSLGTRPMLRAQSDGQTFPSVISTGLGGLGDVGKSLDTTLKIHVASPPMSIEATKVWLKLQEKVAFHFPDDTPLEDVIKYVRQSTRDQALFPSGIPIYLDPQGLQDADKTKASPVTIELEGIPLARTLRIVLMQLGLTYFINEAGYVDITSMVDEENPVDANLLILENLSALRVEVRALRDELRARRPGDGPMPAQKGVRPGISGGARDGFR